MLKKNITVYDLHRADAEPKYFNVEVPPQGLTAHVYSIPKHKAGNRPGFCFICIDTTEVMLSGPEAKQAGYEIVDLNLGAELTITGLEHNPGTDRYRVSRVAPRRPHYERELHYDTLLQG